jgi:hypothetical protein
LKRVAEKHRICLEKTAADESVHRWHLHPGKKDPFTVGAGFLGFGR